MGSGKMCDKFYSLCGRFLNTVFLVGICLCFCNSPSSLACTRTVYLGENDQIVTGRTMDWTEDVHTNLWIFPRGMDRNGAMGKNSLEWTSKYGSLAASFYEGATVDGINEKGLVTNLLYLVESEFPSSEDSRPALVISAWAQYVLDSFATVAEAVASLEQEKFRVASVMIPNGSKGNGHLAISDPSGDSAIFEYIGGKLVIHHGKEYQVMTNSPTYDQQLALDAYWKEIGGSVMLPGTKRAADRFVRASFYIDACRQSGDPREAVADVFSVLCSVSVPRGIRTPGKPNASSTIWRTVADQKNKVYYFGDTANPGALWVKLKGIDFSEGSGVRKLTLVGQPDLVGDQTGGFEKAEPFAFISPSSN